MRRGDWWATVHGVAKSQTRLSDFHRHSPGWFVRVQRLASPWEAPRGLAKGGVYLEGPPFNDWGWSQPH